MTEFTDGRVGGDHAHQLTRLSRAFTEARALDDILHLAVDQAADLLYADRAVLMLTDDDGCLRVRAAHGIEAAVVEQFQHPLNESLVARLRGLLGSHLATGFVGVPIVVRGNVVGLLATVRPDGSAPTHEDESTLSALADQVAAPLENARLAKQLESASLLAENVRLYEAEHDARLVAEAALREAEAARDTAVHADASKTSFLAAMSHELRTPLNAIGGYVDLLAMGLRGPVTTEQADDLRRIKSSQRHLLQLINEVLEYARLGSTRTVLHLDDIDLNTVLGDADMMVQPQILKKKLNYTYVPLATPVKVRADADRLKQIVLNLLTNAIKFTEPGGTIRMICETGQDTTRKHGGPVARISVEDTGRGIPDDQIEAIWQPFVQLGRHLHQPAEGIGLGLAISRDLARRIGGELSVTSEVERGSTFTLTVPLVRTPAMDGY